VYDVDLVKVDNNKKYVNDQHNKFHQYAKIILYFFELFDDVSVFPFHHDCHCQYYDVNKKEYWEAL
jgi:hypothetical protein